MRVWYYVIAVDDGGAPNFDPPLATLALCKPKIRFGAEVGDLVLAFTGSGLGPEPHAVRWAGIVAEKLDFAAYWNDPRFRDKRPGGTSAMPDNIYCPGVEPGRLIQVPNRKHRAEHIEADLGGRFVLVFERWWHFGPAAPVMPDAFGLRMTGGRRGHRRSDIDESNWRQLEAWLDRHTGSITVMPAEVDAPASGSPSEQAGRESARSYRPPSQHIPPRRWRC